MKIQIRSNVFETNSSSMHSIAVSKVNGKYTDEEVYESFKYYDKHYGRKEDLHIQFLNDYMKDKEDTCFGRYPFAVLSTYCDKLRYYIASKAYVWDDEEYKTFLDSIKKKYPRIKSFTFTKRTNSEKKYESNDYNYGNVDHQSSTMLSDFLVKNNLSVDDFLTNKKYIVIVDGDEYGVSTHLVNAKIIELEQPLFKGGEFTYVE